MTRLSRLDSSAWVLITLARYETCGAQSTSVSSNSALKQIDGTHHEDICEVRVELFLKVAPGRRRTALLVLLAACRLGVLLVLGRSASNSGCTTRDVSDRLVQRAADLLVALACARDDVCDVGEDLVEHLRDGREEGLEGLEGRLRGLGRGGGGRESREGREVRGEEVEARSLLFGDAEGGRDGGESEVGVLGAEAERGRGVGGEGERGGVEGEVDGRVRCRLGGVEVVDQGGERVELRRRRVPARERM